MAFNLTKMDEHKSFWSYIVIRFSNVSALSVGGKDGYGTAHKNKALFGSGLENGLFLLS